MGDRLRKLAVAGVVVALVALGSSGGILADRAVYAAPDTPGSVEEFQGCWGTGSGMGSLGGMMGYGMFLDRVTVDKLTKLLGISADDLQTRLREGKSLAEIAQGRATEQQLVETILATRNEMMQLSVKQGYLTQEQADRMIKWMESAVKTFVNNKAGALPGGFGHGMGSGADMSGMMGGAGMSGMMGGSGGMMGGNGGYGPSSGGMMGRARSN